MDKKIGERGTRNAERGTRNGTTEVTEEGRRQKLRAGWRPRGFWFAPSAFPLSVLSVTSVVNFFALATLMAAVCSGCREEPAGVTTARIGGETFHLELALTPAQLEHGLMGRASVAEHGGMVFVFPDAAVREFWMKNCLCPLDILYLNERGRVVSLMRMDPPKPGTPESELLLYSSRWPAQFAVELRAGTIGRLGLKEGDVVEMDVEGLKRRVE